MRKEKRCSEKTAKNKQKEGGGTRQREKRKGKRARGEFEREREGDEVGFSKNLSKPLYVAFPKTQTVPILFLTEPFNQQHTHTRARSQVGQFCLFIWEKYEAPVDPNSRALMMTVTGWGARHRPSISNENGSFAMGSAISRTRNV